MGSKKDNEFLIELYRKGLISADSIKFSFDGKPFIDLKGTPVTEADIEAARERLEMDTNPCGEVALDAHEPMVMMPGVRVDPQRLRPSEFGRKTETLWAREPLWTHETMMAREEHARRKRVKEKMKERKEKCEW